MVNIYILKLMKATRDDIFIFYHNLAYLMAERGGTETQCTLIKKITSDLERHKDGDWISLKNPEVNQELSELLNHIKEKNWTFKLINGDNLINQILDSPDGV